MFGIGVSPCFTVLAGGAGGASPPPPTTVIEPGPESLVIVSLAPVEPVTITPAVEALEIS